MKVFFFALHWMLIALISVWHVLFGSLSYPISLLILCCIGVQAVPLQFLNALLGYLRDSTGYEDSNSGLKSPLASLPTHYPGIDMPCEELVRWQLRLEYFAYETLQDLRIAKLFEIIVDYPDRFSLFLHFFPYNFELYVMGNYLVSMCTSVCSMRHSPTNINPSTSF